jgi:exopolysaccharide biosynthesis polyprenyl glycosylphosphotransferase
MIQQQVYIINTILMVVDALCVIAAGYGAYYIDYRQSYGIGSIDTTAFSVSVLLVMFLNNYVMGKFKLYGDTRPSSYLSLLWAVLKVIIVDFTALTAGVFLFRQHDYSQLFLLSFAGLCFLMIATIRFLSQFFLNKFSKNEFNARKILVVGDLERGKLVSNLLSNQLSWGHKVIGTLAIDEGDNNTEDAPEGADEFAGILRTHTIDEVVFALDGDRTTRLPLYLDICKKIGVPVRILPALWSPGDKVLSIEKCQEVPFLTIRVSNFNATGLLYKRILDLVGGLVGTILLLFIYPFVAAAIKFDSKGPVIFKQKRVGQHGRIFNLYKFRTMYKDAGWKLPELMDRNVMNGAMFKLENDPRITRSGNWLRKTSLDEFPQFLNVLKGEMSLVGTRPPTIEEVDTYKPDHLKRISTKPGITGLWQVSGRNKITDFEKVVELDCSYMDNWRFSDDLKILLKTIFVVFQRKGAL